MKRTILGLSSLALLAATAGSAESPELLRLPPEECVQRLRSARISHMYGDSATELRNLRAAAETFPQEIAPIYGLLEYHRNHGLPEDEERDLRALLARRLEAGGNSLPIGVLTWIARDPDAEQATLRKVASLVAERLGGDPAVEDPDLLEMMAALQQRLELDEEALETLTRLDRLRPSDVTRWTRFSLYSRLGRWSEAADLLRAMVDEQPFTYLRGAYIRLLGKAGRVEEQFEQIEIFLDEHGHGELPGAAGDAADPVLTLDGTLNQHLVPGVLWMAGWEMRDAGNDEQAQRLFRRILDIDPEHRGARSVLVQLYGTAEERRALAAAQEERWGGETDPQALFDEGTRRLTVGDAEAAIDFLRRAAPSFPDLEAAWYNLGMAAYRLEEWETVASAFGRAADLNPQRAEAFFFRGIALVKLERCADALGALERALTLDPKRTLAHYYLSSCYATLGDRAAAARHRQLYDASQ